jgi:tetratricopeptide (TPR) repeat protein
MERAIALLIEQGSVRDAAVLQNNLALARYPLEGPARSLAAFEDAIAFSKERGLAESAAQIDCDCPGLLAELGHTEEALERAARLAGVFEAVGDAFALSTVRAAELAIRLCRGERESSSATAEWLTEAAQAIGTADMHLILLPSAAAALAMEAPERARALLVELAQAKGMHESPFYARRLPEMVRTSVAAGDPAVAKRLVYALELRCPSEEHALCAARAQLAWQEGEFEQGANLFAEAASRWQQFGNVPERAHALLGRGRCLRALGRAGAEEPLLEARELFASMDYKPALAEAEALLTQSPAPAP